MRVIVIGTGIAGASIAFHLAAEGVEVVVADADHPGKATLAGAGIVCPWATANTDPDFYRLYAAAGGYYSTLVPTLADRGITDIGYRRVGALVVSDDAAALDDTARRLEQRATVDAEAGEIHRLSGEAAAGFFPPLRRDLEALFVQGGARVDGAALAAALMSGADLHQAVAERVQIEADGGRVRGVRTAAGIVEADAVVVAGGAWSAELLTAHRVPHPVEPQKGQIIHLRLDGVDTSQWPSVLPLGPHYMLAFDDSRVVVGATREDSSGFDTRVTVSGQAEVLAAALDYAPGLADATVVETRVGLRPYPLDGRPIIGPVAAIDGLYICNGLGAAGLTIGPLAGRLVSQLVLGRQPDLDVSAFAP